MRKDEAARRSSTLDDLFAERQIYVRSGLASRYVVVSRPLQIGVTVGAALIVPWLAFASYNSVAQRLEAAELSRELVRLEALNESLRAAAEAAPEAEAAEHLQTLAARVPELEAARAAGSDDRDGAEIEQLTRRLQTSQAEVRRLRGDLEAALDDAAALRRTAEASEAHLAALQAEMAQLREQPPPADAAGPDLAELKAPDAAPADETAELEADLVAAETRIGALSADLEQAKNELDAARGQPALRPAAAAGAPEDAAAGEGELTQMRAELREARQRIGELERALQQSLVDRVPLPPPAAPR